MSMNVFLFHLVLFLSAVASFSDLLGQRYASLSDEFDDASSVANWTQLNDTDGWNADKLEVHDIKWISSQR